jgi:hypothetical protein
VGWSLRVGRGILPNSRATMASVFASSNLPVMMSTALSGW